jgi:hypothetical protein
MIATSGAAFLPAGRRGELMKRRAASPTLLLSLASVLSALLCSSCGPKGARLHPVRGQVFLAEKPAEGAVVVFHPAPDPGPQVPRPSGRVGADGSFTLGTHAPGDGAAAGDYAVAITWLAAGATSGPRPQALPNRLPARYADPQTSKLRARVREGSNELTAFHLGK